MNFAPRITIVAALCLCLPAVAEENSLCGDVNADGRRDLTDGVRILNWLFLGSSAPECTSQQNCGDLNGDSQENIADAIHLLNWLFLGGPAPTCSVERAIEGFTSIGTNTLGYAEYRHDRTRLDFVLLPGGTFLMGSPDDECERLVSEGPNHEVSLSPFLMAKYEISQIVWDTYMPSNPSPVRGDDLPVETISWRESRDFVELTDLELPSEAQWEYACRAGSTTPFYFGESISALDANFRGDIPYCGVDLAGNYRQTTLPVDSLAPNAFGLHHMHGNVVEWCEDVFSLDFYGSQEGQGTDPVANSGSPFRAARGGCWDDRAAECRSAFRYWGTPNDRGLFQSGIRPVKNLGR